MNQKSPRQNSSGQAPRKFAGRQIPGSLIWLLILAFAIGAFFFYRPGGSSTTEISYSSFINQVTSGHVASVEMTGNDVTGTLKSPQVVESGKSPITRFKTTLPNI